MVAFKIVTCSALLALLAISEGAVLRKGGDLVIYTLGSTGASGSGYSSSSSESSQSSRSASSTRNEESSVNVNGGRSVWNGRGLDGVVIGTRVGDLDIASNHASSSRSASASSLSSSRKEESSSVNVNGGRSVWNGRGLDGVVIGTRVGDLDIASNHASSSRSASASSLSSSRKEETSSVNVNGGRSVLNGRGLDGVVIGARVGDVLDAASHLASLSRSASASSLSSSKKEESSSVNVNGGRSVWNGRGLDGIVIGTRVGDLDIDSNHASSSRSASASSLSSSRKEETSSVNINGGRSVLNGRGLDGVVIGARVGDVLDAASHLASLSRSASASSSSRKEESLLNGLWNGNNHVIAGINTRAVEHSILNEAQSSAIRNRLASSGVSDWSGVGVRSLVAPVDLSLLDAARLAGSDHRSSSVSTSSLSSSSSHFVNGKEVKSSNVKASSFDAGHSRNGHSVRSSAASLDAQHSLDGHSVRTSSYNANGFVNGHNVRSSSLNSNSINGQVAGASAWNSNEELASGKVIRNLDIGGLDWEGRRNVVGLGTHLNGVSLGSSSSSSRSAKTSSSELASSSSRGFVAGASDNSWNSGFGSSSSSSRSAKSSSSESASSSSRASGSSWSSGSGFTTY